MALVWNAKENFIFLHFLLRRDTSVSKCPIDWSLLVHDISSEIFSTPSLLKTQYEFLLSQHQSAEDVKTLYSKVKQNYFNVLCEDVNIDREKIVQIIYELVRHVRAKRIFIEDIQQLIQTSRSNDAPDEQKKNGEDFPKILTRLCQSGLVSSTADHPSSTIPKETIEVVLDSDDTIAASTSTTAKANTRRSIANISEQEKSSPTRPRSQSLTSKTNIGHEWFTPKLQHEQRSSSIQMQEVATSVHDAVREISDERVTTSKTDETVRQTEVQPTISWAPLTEEQAAERERQRVQMKYFDYDNLDEVSSSDSDSIEIQSSSVSEKNLDQQPLASHSSKKRQRLS